MITKPTPPVYFIRKYYTLIVISVICQLASTGCKGSSDTNLYTYVAQLSALDQTYIYDHSDDRQHAFFLEHLKNQGLSEKTSPGLYKSLQALRDHHIDLRKKGKVRSDIRIHQKTIMMGQQVESWSPVEGTGPQTPVIGKFGPVRIITSSGIDENDELYATSLLSVNSSSWYANNTLELFNGEERLGHAQVEETYFGGESLMAEASAKNTGKNNNGLQAKMTFYHLENGESLPQTGHTFTSIPFCIFRSNCPEYHSIEPKGKNDSIIICITRTGSSYDCTYFYAPKGGDSLFIPLKGKLTFGSAQILVFDGTDKVNTDSIGVEASVTVSDLEQGNGSSLSLKQDFFAHPNTRVSANGDTLKWNMDGYMGSVKTLLERQGALYRVGFVQKIKVKSTKGDLLSATITNIKPELFDHKIGKMFITYGCLAEGTMVEMADGKTKRIEDVLVGDRVLSNNEGDIHRVTATTKGREIFPMYHISTASVKELLLTKNHPVVTADGRVLLARELSTGIPLITRQGNEAIQKVELVTFEKPVWNLILEPVDTKQQPDSTNSTFFANGIKVGDHRMQSIYQKLYRSNTKNVLELLDKDWSEDYRHYLSKQ
ncbi:MAG TPA: hypothetical protein DDW81_18350 [Cryomorphaceae bacterium]|nr:hypothetical protein [Owenweeksia sp.]HBF22068.1 hypothetical protein [Cryomorphaceae bacterium]|tara:strand:- start:2213 stop:4012 length:1800 start_codon:yes stop_codon:yes gene_type:complete